MADEDVSVPFGKYKGRPVEDMLADGDYMIWLEAQPWFRERFAYLLRARDQDALSRTPEHNKLQALFLSDPYRRAFFRVAAPDLLPRWEAAALKASLKAREAYRVAANAAEEAEQSLADHADEPYHFMRSTWQGSVADAVKFRERWEFLQFVNPVVLHIGAEFEHAGADVLLKVAATWTPASLAFEEDGQDAKLAIEIKPTVADDYPAVLRQMRRNGCHYLFLGAYDGSGATEAEFVSMFEASERRVVFKRDVDAFLARS